MTLEFTDIIPRDLRLNPVLISGSVSVVYSKQMFLILSEDRYITGLYEIRYETHCSPFKEALLIDGLLAVGHEEYFYLFNTTTNQNILRLKMDWYFGHLYYDTGSFYVADATGLYCINNTGEVIWNNNELAVDGVVIHKFTDSKISGSGEFDPPGGWIGFSIHKATGIKSAS